MKNIQRGHVHESGFTLIEIMVVISIIAVLSSVVYASVGPTKARARDAQRAAETEQLRTALTSYSLDHGGVPSASSTASGCSQTAGPTVIVCTTGIGVDASLQPLVTGGYISKIPLDPLNTSPYSFYYSTGPATSIDPITGTPISPNGSFDYVNEGLTAQSNGPVLLGTNIGTPDYTTYPGSGYPSNASTNTSGTVAPTVPGQPTNMYAQTSFGNSQFGYNSHNSFLTAVASQGPGPTPPNSSSLSAPTTAAITLSWGIPASGSYPTGYTIMKNGTPIASVGGTSYTDTINLPTAATVSNTYTVSAYNSAGTSNAVSALVKIPPVSYLPVASVVMSQAIVNGVQVGLATMRLISTPAPAGTVYTLIYSKDSNVTRNYLGSITIDNTGSATSTTYGNSVQLNLSTPTYWEADLSSIPTVNGN